MLAHMHDTDDTTERDEVQLAAAILAPDGLPTMAHSPREHYAPLVEARLVCLGCRHYMDMLIPSGDRGPDDEDPRMLQRWCLRHGDLDLSDAEVFACSKYAPRKWWTVSAWKQRARCRAMIAFARERIKQHTIENAQARGVDYGDFIVVE